LPIAVCQVHVGGGPSARWSLPRCCGARLANDEGSFMAGVCPGDPPHPWSGAGHRQASPRRALRQPRL